MKKRMWKIGMIMALALMLMVGCGESKDDNHSEISGDIQTEENETLSVEEESTMEMEPYVLKFTGTTLDGDTLTSECFSNAKLTMVNVWATFCGPCINEMPDLGEIATEYDASDFQLIGIISDVIEGQEGDTFTDAKEIIEETGANYTHLLLNEELYVNLVGASDSVPTTYFFNEKGEYLGYLVGAQTKEVWKQIIDNLLAELE